MVTIHCEVIDAELVAVARMIANRQKDVVKLIGSTETLEVRYEEVSEMQESETQEKDV